MSDQKKVKRALAGLDALAAIWATRIGLQGMVNGIQAMPRLKMLEAIHALAKQAFVEGAYEGRTSPRAAPPLRLAVEQLCSQTGEDPDEFEKWLCDGGLAQMALSHFARQPSTASPSAQRYELDWVDAPMRTQWGFGMKEALIELSKDATARIFAHADDLQLVPGALQKLSAAPPPAGAPT